MNRRFVFVLLALSIPFAAGGMALGAAEYQRENQRQAPTASFDTCLRGEWREVELSVDSEIVDEEKITLTGAGRMLRFDNGVETVDYGSGVTYSGKSPWYDVAVERTGTINYQVHVNGNRLVFTGMSSDASERIMVNGTELSKQLIGLDSAPMMYECGPDKLVLTDSGYRSVLERVRLTP